jgi:hypothetical protein
MGGLRFRFDMSEKLRFMLGLDQIKYTQSYDAYWVKSLPSIMDSVNEMYIYCDKVEGSIVGDSSSQLLAVAHIELRGQGSGELLKK